MVPRRALAQPRAQRTGQGAAAAAGHLTLASSAAPSGPDYACMPCDSDAHQAARSASPTPVPHSAINEMRCAPVAGGGAAVGRSSRGGDGRGRRNLRRPIGTLRPGARARLDRPPAAGPISCCAHQGPELCSKRHPPQSCAARVLARTATGTTLKQAWAAGQRLARHPSCHQQFGAVPG